MTGPGNAATPATPKSNHSLETDQLVLHSFPEDTFADVKAEADAIPEKDWRDVGNGVKMTKLMKIGRTQAVLFRIADGASPEAFTEHSHPGGELWYLVEGEIYDENEKYKPGQIIFMHAGTTHTPRARGNTLIFVLWPLGIVFPKKA